MQFVLGLSTWSCCALLACSAASQTLAPINPGILPSPQIIGGTNSVPSDYPSVGSLLAILHYGSTEAAAMGSATLIAPDVVLTAAHVLTPDPSATSVDFYFTLALNVSNFEATLSLPSDAVRVNSFATLPGWDPSGSTIGSPDAKDLGLAFLETAITTAAPAAVTTTNDSPFLQFGSPIEIVGYGVSSSTDTAGLTAGIKRQATSHIWAVTDAMIVQSGTPNTCEGDSGGPVFLSVPDGRAPTLRIVGVCSYGDQDCQNGYSMRLDRYLDWIDQTMRQACSLGKRVSSACQDGGGIPPLREIHISIQYLPPYLNGETGALLSWNTLGGKYYNLKGTTNLQGTWMPLVAKPIQAAGQQLLWTNWTSWPTVFYRVFEFDSP
jgi:V8-like Glu-specific endopeptidase